MKKQKLAGILFLAFPLVLQIPFTLLSMIYDYPDILRKPAAQILQSFYEGGPALLLAWYAYALSILIFLAALLIYQPIRASSGLASALRVVGVLSATIQMIALLRWTFIVPLLARLYWNAPSAEARGAIEAIFQVQHQFLGVGLGEHMGQLSLVVWTLLMLRDQRSFPLFWKILGYSAALILTLGLVEHLAEVFAFDAGIFAHGALVGFLLWSLWLIAVGIKLLRGSNHAAA